MKQAKLTTKAAGIDVSKPRLDVALHGSEDMLQVSNDPARRAELIGWLKAQGVTRVGLEATAGYEKALVLELQQAGFEVVVHQPLEVRLFARLRRWKAKNDQIDARLIAAATAQVDAVKAAADPRLAELAERLTAYEQISDLLAQLKTMIEHVSLPDLMAVYRAEASQLMARKRSLGLDLIRRIRAHADLARRYQLLLSLPGVGAIVAAVLVVRMPELGAMKRGEASSLIGVAPFDRDSGGFRGQRAIWGGRYRPRRFLYLAALAAKRWDPSFKAFAAQLLARGKAAKLVITAIMRKLIEAANIVLGRGTPWVEQASASA
jgi:transposase